MAETAHCRACGVVIEPDELRGRTGMHRYCPIGPASWQGLIDSYDWPECCWCGERATIRVSRGHAHYWACSPAHARSKRIAETATPNPWAQFAVVCYPGGGTMTAHRLMTIAIDGAPTTQLTCVRCNRRWPAGTPRPVAEQSECPVPEGAERIKTGRANHGHSYPGN